MEPDKILDAALSQLTDAVVAAFKPAPGLPAFILLYASIDIFASLTRPIEAEDTDSRLFKDWVKSYMLPNSALRCNEHDLWGARCGFLHTLRVESKSSRDGKARELHYVNGPPQIALAIQQKFVPDGSLLVIGTSDLLTSYIRGVKLFVEAVQSNPTLSAVVLHHAAKLIVNEDLKASELGFEIIPPKQT